MGKEDQVMRQLKRELQQKIDAAEDAARDQAHQLANAIRAKAPVDTGALRDSVRVVNTPQGARVIVGGGAVDYADDVEREEPFIEPAVHEVRAGYEAAMRKAVE
jgi:hypothetical protein